MLRKIIISHLHVIINPNDTYKAILVKLLYEIGKSTNQRIYCNSNLQKKFTNELENLVILVLCYEAVKFTKIILDGNNQGETSNKFALTKNNFYARLVHLVKSTDSKWEFRFDVEDVDKDALSSLQLYGQEEEFTKERTRE